MNERKTVIIGASPNPSRYAYVAAQMLKEKSVPFVPVGIKRGEVGGETIQDLRLKPAIEDVHTVTLYLAPKNQKEWQEYILSLRPRRIIFNPGTENPELMESARAHNIDVVPACSLVMLSSGQY
ncbi:CoA-binding protein [Negadavirga shengliensis]|uniref:CoA-binding protein n=1 Tax=Negadavirga shengliensis TaxID=1389218 RepID=A0ABV9T1S9_9BACT